jgi:integrase
VGGKKKEKKVGPCLKDALEEKLDRERKIRRGKYAVIEKQEKLTFRELFELYEEKGDEKKYILKFKQAYLDYFGGWKLAQITREDIFAFRDKVKATPKQRGGQPVTDSSVNRAMAALRRLFNFAVNRQIMEDTPFPKNPKSGLFYSEKKGFRRFFTQDQVVQIVNASPKWLKPIVLTAYYTGMRVGEILKLRWEHVNLENGVINLPSSKTLKDPSGLGQRIVMQRALISIFKDFARDSEWVFSKQDGLPYQHWNVIKPFKAVLKSVGSILSSIP